MWVERCEHDRQESSTKKIAAKTPSGSIAQRTTAVFFVQHASCTACSLRLIYYDANREYTASHNLHAAVPCIRPISSSPNSLRLNEQFSSNAWHDNAIRKFRSSVEQMIGERNKGTNVSICNAVCFSIWNQSAKRRVIFAIMISTATNAVAKRNTPFKCYAFLYLWVPDNRYA